VWGRCWEGGGAPAYLPWVDVLRTLIIHEPRERERRSALPPEIAQLIPELSAETDSPRTPSDPTQARFRLFDAIATLLKQVASSAPLLIVLDDLHEADHSSLELLKFVARGLPDSRIVIVGMYRDAEVRRSPYLSETIAEILRYGRAIQLAGLDQNEVTQMVEDRAQRLPSAAFASELYRVTAGNPLFVDGIIRVLAAEHKLETSERLELKGFNLPEGVRGAIRKRLALLSAEAQSVLTIAAAIGQEFDPALLQRVSQLNAETLAELMSETSEVGVVAAASREGYRFTHPLIRESLYNGSTDAERMRLHRAIGEALEQMPAANLTPHLAALAHHFRAAHVAQKAIDYSIGAGQAASAVFAYEEARSHCEEALELMEGEFDSPERRAGLSVVLARLSFAIDQGAAIRYAEVALSLYESLGDVVRAAKSHAFLGSLFSVFGEPTANVRLAEEHFRKAEPILSEGPEGKALARLYIGIAATKFMSLRTGEGLAAGKRAMEIAERFHDDSLWAEAARHYGVHLFSSGRLAEGHAIWEQAWQMADRLNDAAVAFTSTWSAGGFILSVYDIPEAQRWYQRELSKPRGAQAPFYRRMLLALLGEALARAGDLAGARRLCTGAVHTLILAGLLFYEGRWDEAEAAILDQMAKSRHLGDLATLSLCLSTLANTYRVSGRLQEALVLFEEYLTTVSSEPYPLGEILVRSIIASICVQIGSLDAAERELVRCREIMALGEDWRGLAGFVVRAEAVVSAATGKYEGAEAQFEKAIEIFRRYQVPFEEADALYYWGRALNASGEHGLANEKLDAAIEIYRRCGAGQRWVDRVEADRNTGVSRSSTTSDNGTFPPIFRKEGEYWKTAYEGGSANVRERGGMRFIAQLLARPGEDIPAIEMFATLSAGAGISPAQDGLSAASDLGDAGEKFDARALSEYRRRLAEVESEIEAAEASHDSGAVARARAEKELLLEEISSGTRLDGGLRRVASHRERARVNVTRQIKSAIEAIRNVNPPLGRHLANAIQTGSTCRYAPADRIKWRL